MQIQIDPSKKIFYHSNVLFSIRILIALLGSTLIPVFLGEIRAIIPLTLGVIAAAISDIDASPKQRLKNLSILLSCFGIAAFSVELLFPYPWLFLLGLILSGFFFTIMGALGQTFSVISFGTLLMATYTMVGIELYDQKYLLSFLLLVGATWYGCVAWIESIIQPIRTTHESLNQSFLTLRDFLNAKAHMFDPDETDDFRQQTKELTKINQQLIQSMNQTKRSLFNRLRGDQGHQRVRIMLNFYFVAQDIHERANSSHMNYQVLSNHLRNSDILFRLSRLMTLQANACEKIANAIKYRQPYNHHAGFDRSFKILRESIHRADVALSIKISLLNILKNLEGIDKQFQQINQANYISQDTQHNNIVDNEVANWRDAYERIKQNLSLKSGLFRHAIRMSIVFALGYGIIQVTQLQHGYWVIMTSLFVCQPNYATTQKRLFLRVIGTITGIILGVFFVYLFDTLATQLFAIIVSGWLFFLFRNSRYAFATAFITLLVFFNFNLTGENSWDVAWYRILATLIGSGIAWLAVSFLWPDWKYRTLPNLVTTANQDNARYLTATNQQYQSERIDHVDYRFARREAHDNSADLSALISIMSNEPKVNQALIDTAFQFLTLNHTLISYISTLGAHRTNELTQNIQSYFNEITQFINHALCSNTIDESRCHSYYGSLETLLNQFTNSQYTEVDYQVIQQLQLMLQILPDIIKTSQHLNQH